MSTPFVIPSNRMLKQGDWLFDEEKPMQTAAGRRKSSMPESVTGNHSKLVDKRADHDALLLRGAANDDDAVRPWTDAELSDYETWHSGLIGRLVNLYA